MLEEPVEDLRLGAGEGLEEEALFEPSLEKHQD